ncbi:hypothetical protein OG948_59820 (plasmid) [Embleya sp. NBC_00888]|uniref:hypothetical protein n=1 Tax=Embleya sp. NBC_00888 TaxID=2975960 RepID=UPI0038670498|nr:hypothetical protein OG948_59820 [Embleya sp. NBC_00888]
MDKSSGGKSGGHKGRGGHGHGGSGGHTPMTSAAASRIQSSASRNPSGKSAETDFAPRAQSAAATNEAGGGSSGRR